MLIYLETYQSTTTSIGTGTALIHLITCSPCTSFSSRGISLSCARGALTAYIRPNGDCGRVMTNLRAVAMSLSEILQLDAKIPSQNQKFEVPPTPQKHPQRSGPAADWQLHSIGRPTRKRRAGCETGHCLSDTLGSKVSGLGGGGAFGSS